MLLSTMQVPDVISLGCAGMALRGSAQAAITSSAPSKVAAVRGRAVPSGRPMVASLRCDAHVQQQQRGSLGQDELRHRCASLKGTIAWARAALHPFAFSILGLCEADRAPPQVV